MVGNRVTLKDIATKVGLSLATVSRALADHPDISGKTKERVREVAQTLNYIPNYRARYLPDSFITGKESWGMANVGGTSISKKLPVLPHAGRCPSEKSCAIAEQIGSHPPNPLPRRSPARASRS